MVSLFVILLLIIITYLRLIYKELRISNWYIQLLRGTCVEIDIRVDQLTGKFVRGEKFNHE